jgi:hypothetical protein
MQQPDGMFAEHNSCGCCCWLQFGGIDLDPASSTLWFAGKQLLPDKLLSEYMGRNERTRAVVKLQKKGQGPPAREPVSSACLASGFALDVPNCMTWSSVVRPQHVAVQ